MTMQPWLAGAPVGPILRPAAAARFLGISQTSYYDLAAQGALPKPLKIGTRATGIPVSWLNAVIADRAGESIKVTS